MRAARLGGCGDVFELGGHGADEDAHVLHPHRIAAVAGEFLEMKYRLGDRGRELRGRVVDAEAAVAEPRSLGIEVRERRHHIARSRSRDALVGRHQRDLADLVAGARIGELLQRDQRLPDGRIGRQPLEQEDRRVAGSDDAPGLRPIDRTRRHLSAPGRSRRVEIGSHGRQIDDVAAFHAIERAASAEGCIRAFDPAVGEMRVRVDDLQRLVNSRDVADPSQGIHRHPDGVSAAPGIIGPFPEDPRRTRASSALTPQASMM